MVERVRVATDADAEWLLALAEELYPNWTAARAQGACWIGKALKADGTLFLRSANAAACFSLVTWFYRPDAPEAHALFIGARPGAHFQVVSILQAAVPWLRERGAAVLRLGADTHADFGPYVRLLAQRHGWKWTQDVPSYRVHMPWAVSQAACSDRRLA